MALMFLKQQPTVIIAGVEMDNVSLIIPVHNEKRTLEENCIKLYGYMKENCANFEILLCDNGSTDDTFEISQRLHQNYGEIKAFKAIEKGIGIGIKIGIENAKFDTLMFYAIDLPFGLDVINNSFEVDADVVVGSKAHKDSVVERTFKRAFFSFAYNIFIRMFFGLNVKDTQGSLMFRKGDINKFLLKLDSSDAFFETQLLIHCARNKLKIVEIPVNLSAEVRGSKIRPVKDGLNMLMQIIRERLRR